ncbi:MAG: DUF2281 domain-containing protein [Micrococcales bacterium]|nr:DUF2281 domain-containing protein [Micrococcales bacterium]
MPSPEPSLWHKLEQLPPARLAEVVDFVDFLSARETSDQPARKPRTLGRLAGKLTVPDDFDAPLPDDILNAFYGQTS